MTLVLLPNVLRVALLSILTLLVSFGPGWFVVRRFAWTPLETLVASVGLSFTSLFVLSFIAFWAGAPAWVDAAIAFGAAGLTLTAIADARRLWQDETVRRLLLSLTGLAVWTLLLLSLIRQYGGGDWCCDWLEHYERTQNFVTPLPIDFLYIGQYPLSARPPLMNVVVAQLLSPVGLSFPAFQVVFSLLNALVLLPCCLVGRVLARNGRAPDPRLLAILLGANPMFFMNTTYAWTKVFAAFFVLLGVALYVAGWRARDRLRLSGAFLALGAATVTHYSAAPVAVMLVLHGLVMGRSALRRWRDLAVIAAPMLLVAGLWVAYATTTFGGAVLQNSSLGGTTPSSTTTRVLNVVDTFVPRPYGGYRGYPDDASQLRRTADQIFALYQGNAILSMGLIPGLLCLLLLRSARRTIAPRERTFWALFVLSLWLVGALLHGDRITSGLAMVSLQPVTYVALAFLSTRLTPLPTWARYAWFFGLLIDVILGIALPLWFQRGAAWAYTPNWDLKARMGLQFVGDHVQFPAVAVTALLLIAAFAIRFAYQHVVARVPIPLADTP